MANCNIPLRLLSTTSSKIPPSTTMRRHLFSCPPLWLATLATSSRTVSAFSSRTFVSSSFSSSSSSYTRPAVHSFSPFPSATTTATTTTATATTTSFASKTSRLFSTDPSSSLLLSSEFQAGDKVQVEVVQFGPLGATVEVIGRGHGDDAVLLDAEKEPLGTGLILQKEISYFRQARHMVDVVRGEILPAYVQNVRDEDGKLDIGLRAFGGKAKAQEVGDVILEILEQRDDGFLPVGDKSAPEDINRELPGVSKSAFKKAVGALYKKGLIQPSPYSLTLVAKK